MKEKDELSWNVSYTFQYNVLNGIKTEVSAVGWCFYREAEAHWGSYLIDCIKDDLIFKTENDLVYLTHKGEFLLIAYKITYANYSIMELFEGKNPDTTIVFEKKVPGIYVSDINKYTLRSIIGLSDENKFTDMECILWD